LPDVKPSPIAAAPELGDNDRRKFRRIAIPTQEIIKRPVVTRNPVVTKNPSSDGSNGIVGQRERRVIVPRSPDNSKSTPIFRDRGTDRGVERRPKMDGGSSDSRQNNGQNNDSDGARHTKIRVPLPSPADKVETDGSAREKRQRRDDSSNTDQQRRPIFNYDRPADSPRRVQEQPPVQRNKDNSSNDQSRDGQDHQRDKRPPTSDSKPREDARPKAEEPRHPDRSNPPQQPRVEPRQERSNSDNQSKQERHQENQQRQERAPQQDQHKKP